MFDRKFLPLVLLLSGTFNVLLIKWADKQISKGSDGKLRPFEHPFIQTIVLFFGEFLCFILYKILFLYLSRRQDGSEDINILTAGDREFSPFILILPAFCDLIASYLFFIGLSLTYPSSYQMLRGISLIFVGIFNVSYFDFQLKKQHWFGMLTLILSAILICISDINNVNPNNVNNIDANGILTGDLLILIAIVFYSFQIVYEEKYLKILNLSPLQLIGWEGIFGLLISIILLIPMNFIKNDLPFVNNPNNVIEDINDGLIQLFNNIWLIVCHLLFIILIQFELFSCKYLIKDASSTGVIIIQSISVVFIWIISLILEWEQFYYLQLIAIIPLIIGICIYKNVLFNQLYRFLVITLCRRNREGDGVEEVINQPADAV